MNRTKIVIIGADPSAFHIFNTIYRSDDRYEVQFFLSFEKICDKTTTTYPKSLSGPLYPSGIKIIKYCPFQNYLNETKQCIFSSACVTSSLYLYLAAQCLASECTVVSHSLEQTQLQPTKALVSFFSDTQFDIPILIKILSIYRESKHKPIVVIPGLVSFFPRKTETPDFIQIKNQSQFDEHKFCFDGHTQAMCSALLSRNYEIYIVFDFGSFSHEALRLRNDVCDMICFVGFNSLPCFFSSHLLIYAFDDFTFGDDITHHPSTITAQQADVVIQVNISGSSKHPAFQALETESVSVVQVSASFSAKNDSCYPNRNCVLVDDKYPTSICNAEKSISAFLADHFHIKPVKIENAHKIQTVADSPIYGEPTEKDWPALILPDNEADVSVFCQNALPPQDKYDVIVSSANETFSFAKQAPKPVLEFKFELNLSPLNADLLALPTGAFVRQRRGERF
ncbi:GTPase [Histomonas meleagridis]|uniref:GTPase n=1 Tax=Histomonas meleagridis TaxID=135588 RepID=UPI00355A519B|nr:GTPase [Histomonas meleagridis]KAH0803596.1 GTPase [Histomonas meleagridis]